MKKSIFSILLLLFAVVVQAQIQEPVKFKSELKTSQAGEAEVVFTGTIDKGWHVYSTDLGDGGPISATFNVASISGAELVGKLMMRIFYRLHKYRLSFRARRKVQPLMDRQPIRLRMPEM